MTLPFIEEKISDNLFIRTFKQETDSGEMVWHRDYEDRIIESTQFLPITVKILFNL